MEGASAIFLAMVLLAGGGATGAVMMSEDVDMGHWGMMGGHHGVMGEGSEDCPYHDGDHEECYGEDGTYPEECEEHYEDCPYHDDAGVEETRGAGCC